MDTASFEIQISYPRLNAAFAHDLRTPLTVLKGQSDILIKYTPELSEEKIIETAKMMQRHIARLENYVNTMNTLQRLEDIEIHCKSVDMVHFIKQLRDTGACICADKRFVFQKTQYPSFEYRKWCSQIVCKSGIEPSAFFNLTP